MTPLMIQVMSLFIALLFLCAVFIAGAWGLAWRLVPEHRRRARLRWLLPWSIKGLVLPALLWTIMNLGVSWSLQPFMPEIQAAQNKGGDWLPEFFRVLAAGLFIFTSYLAAVTLGWSLFVARGCLAGETRSDVHAPSRARFLVK